MTSITQANTNTNDNDDDDNRLIKQFAILSSFEDFIDNPADNDESINGRRRSRASMNFFQRETSKLTSTGQETAEVATSRRRNSFIGVDGKVQDEYIAKRASLNKPDKSLNDIVPMLADLTQANTLTRVDGKVLSQLFISGYAKLGSNVDLLNRINVYPIADGDTGANMRVCLKLPSRNLILDPSNSIVRVASNMAADVLLNGQGNSGTILSHFFVSLAEEIGDSIMNSSNSDSLSIDEFALCLSKTGTKMMDAVSNPQEGTIISVCRDSCAQLWTVCSSSYSNLKELLQTWNDLAQCELQKTPDQLIVDGVKVLEKAGVVDSGAQGFVYLVEGMLLASDGKLPEAFDPNLFKTGVKSAAGGYVEEDLPAINDHNVCDSKYQFCTEAVITLKEGTTKKDVMDMIDSECGSDEFGDSIACVSGPTKKGRVIGGSSGIMCKIHIHTNEPQTFFDKLKTYSCDPHGIFKKEKVEDMLMMKELEHGKSTSSSCCDHDHKKQIDLCDAKFTILGTGQMWLPPKERTFEELHSLPMFVLPATTGEPIDVRYTDNTDVTVALNQQRNPDTAIRYTTASSSPMQMKIELLAALGKGKPVLVFVFSADSKVSVFGRNVSQAIDMLDPNQKEMVTVLTHGWGNEASFLLEAIECARDNKTIHETYEICNEYATKSYCKIGFMSSDLLRKMKAWRPGLFPDGLEVKDGQCQVSGTPACLRRRSRSQSRNDNNDDDDDDDDDDNDNDCYIPAETRIQVSMSHIDMGDSMMDAFQIAAQHIKNGLKVNQKITNVLIPCVGRPDYGYILLDILTKTDGIDIVGTPNIYSEGFLGSIIMGSWGSVNLMYKIIE